jgi:putative phage-type endonuclease
MKFLEVLTFPTRKYWLQWRHSGIGASDAPIIMGVSRFKTREKLLVEKADTVVVEAPNSYITQRGNQVEFQVRAFLEKEYSCTYPAMNCVSKSFEFLRASLDGISEDQKTIVEIKLLASIKSEEHNTTEGYRKWNAVKLKGEVPKEYYPQLQHQLAITGAEKCLFVGYKEIKGNLVVTPDKLAITTVYPDKVYIRKLLKKEFEFWLDVWEYKNRLTYKGELE